MSYGKLINFSENLFFGRLIELGEWWVADVSLVALLSFFWRVFIFEYYVDHDIDDSDATDLEESFPYSQFQPQKQKKDSEETEEWGNGRTHAVFLWKKTINTD